MQIVIDGQKVSIPPRGPAGPDGNPIGTIISFMGASAPKDYLVCDGTEYDISAYPKLAALFAEQFGAANHFGGDGTTTFAVPDMRNLFLRGYHGQAEEQLSGEIGERQEATLLQYMVAGTNVANQQYFYCENFQLPSQIQEFIKNQNVDSQTGPSGEYNLTALTKLNEGGSSGGLPQFVTSRPVNMAVLYCIKAVQSEDSGGGPSQEVYSTEETRIGTWADGKPLYRKVFVGTTPNVSGTWTKVFDPIPDAEVKIISCTVETSTRLMSSIPDISSGSISKYCYNGSGSNTWGIPLGFSFCAGVSSFVNKPINAILEYTKTTD